jgi:hypothetical protein
MEPGSICEPFAAMNSSMRNFIHSRPFVAPRTEVVLRLPDGSPWRLTMSKGCERFIGHYPRLAGIEADGAVLSYRRVAGADF